MALTTLDARTALIVIDLQKGIVALPAAHPTDSVIARAVELLDAFRRHGLPVVLVNVTGAAPGRTEQAPRARPPADWAELVAPLKQQPDDHLVTKQTWGAFTHTGLDTHLKQLGVTQIVLAGVSTSIGVESTARFASELGYNLTFALDAMTDLNADAHVNSVTRIFPRLGESGQASEIIAMLDHTRS